MLEYSILNNAPVVWIMQGDKKLAGVSWQFHNGKSSDAVLFAQKIVDALNAQIEK